MRKVVYITHQLKSCKHADLSPEKILGNDEGDKYFIIFFEKEKNPFLFLLQSFGKGVEMGPFDVIKFSRNLYININHCQRNCSKSGRYFNLIETEKCR